MNEMSAGGIRLTPPQEHVSASATICQQKQQLHSGLEENQDVFHEHSHR